MKTENVGLEDIVLEDLVQLEVEELLQIKKMMLDMYSVAMNDQDETKMVQLAYDIAFVSYGIDKGIQDILGIKIVNESPAMALFKARYGQEKTEELFDVNADMKSERLKLIGEEYSVLIEEQEGLEEELRESYQGKQDPRMLPSYHREEAKMEWEEAYSKKLSQGSDGKWPVNIYKPPYNKMKKNPYDEKKDFNDKLD